MKEQRITIEIEADGRLSADAEGFAGDLCLKDLDRLLEGLGPRAQARRKGDDKEQRAARRVTLGRRS